MGKRPILIQIAMEVEGVELLKKIDNLKKIERQGYSFYEGYIDEYPIVVSFSKVGVIQTSVSLELSIINYNPIMVINMGIAGACDKRLKLKDIIIGESVVNINSYRTKQRLIGEGSNPNDWELLTFLSGEEDRFIEYKSNNKLIELAKEVFSLSSNIYLGRIGSGDVWNREIDRIIFLNEKYQILCEDMECIATYTICNQLNIPVISIKMISDNSITNIPYQREVGTFLQDYMLKYLKRIILELKR